MSDLRFEGTASSAVAPAARGFRLGKSNAKIMGVCSGIADSFGWDVTLVRAGFLAGTLIGFGSLVLVYLVVGLLAD